jgi:hypothetical protein
VEGANEEAGRWSIVLSGVISRGELYGWRPDLTQATCSLGKGMLLKLATARSVAVVL